jgi:hypothetical protein
MVYMIDKDGNLVPVTGNVPSNVIEKSFTLATRLGNAQPGEKIMLAVTPGDTSQVTELETYLGGYRQNDYAADLISPVVPVDKETFKRRDFSHLNVFAPTEDRVGRLGAINEVEHASAVIEDKTEEHALAAFITFASENDAVGTYNVRQAHSKLIRDKLDLNREIRRMDKATTVGTWNASNYTTITTNYRWNTGTTKDPMADIRTRMKASWAHVTGILMNLEVSGYFLSDTKVKAAADFAMGTANAKPGVVIETYVPGVQVCRLPGLPPVYIVDAKKYVSGAMTSILADDVILFNSPSSLSGGETLASFLSFRYRGRSGTGYTVNEYVPYGRGLNGGTMLEAGYSDCDCTPGTSADGTTTSRIGGLIKSVLTGS